MDDANEGDPPTDARTAKLLDELEALEDRLDPRPARSGERLADLLMFAVVAFFALVLGAELKYPLLLITLLIAARGLSRLVPFLRNRSLRADRDRLVGPHDGGPAPPGSPRNDPWERR